MYEWKPPVRLEVQCSFSVEEVKSVLGGYQASFDTKCEKEFDIVYDERGTKDDYKDLDVRGKLVLLDINQREEW